MKEESLADANAYYQKLLPFLELHMGGAAAENVVTSRRRPETMLNPFYNMHIRKRVLQKLEVI